MSRKTIKLRRLPRYIAQRGFERIFSIHLLFKDYFNGENWEEIKKGGIPF
jgi:hypothetical protein